MACRHRTLPWKHHYISYSVVITSAGKTEKPQMCRHWLHKRGDKSLHQLSLVTRTLFAVMSCNLCSHGQSFLGLTRPVLYTRLRGNSDEQCAPYSRRGICYFVLRIGKNWWQPSLDNMVASAHNGEKLSWCPAFACIFPYKTHLICDRAG